MINGCPLLSEKRIQRLRADVLVREFLTTKFPLITRDCIG